MVKVPVPVENIMSDPNLSITSSPFAPGDMIIKRASFEAGETPEHLEQYALTGNEGQQGKSDTVVVDGKPIPKSAAAVKAAKDPDYSLD
jgi:hypothetical protein